MPLTVRIVVKMTEEEGDTLTVWETVNTWVGHGAIGEGNSNPLQYSCLGNPMDRRACLKPLNVSFSHRMKLNLIFLKMLQNLASASVSILVSEQPSYQTWIAVKSKSE